MATTWILDAYNFIRSSRRFAEWEAEDPEEGKLAAVEWLARFAEITQFPLCLVFDAYSGLQKNMIDKSTLGIKILESRGGYTADEEIIAMSQDLKEAAVVVSSDREIQRAVIQSGSSILGSEEFEREAAKVLKARDGDEGEDPAPRKGMAFRPPKEKKRAYQLLRSFQKIT